MTSTVPTTTSPNPGSVDSGPVRPRDLGASFLELLVAIVLLGTAGVAVLASMSAATVGARTSDEVADIQSLLSEASVLVGDTYPELVPFVACDSGTDVATSYRDVIQAELAEGGRGKIEVVAVRFWNGSAFVSGCTTAHRLQEVELRATLGDSSRAAKVVKRPLAPPPCEVLPCGPIPPAPPGAFEPGEVDVELTPGINGPDGEG